MSFINTGNFLPKMKQNGIDKNDCIMHIKSKYNIYRLDKQKF